MHESGLRISPPAARGPWCTVVSVCREWLGARRRRQFSDAVTGRLRVMSHTSLWAWDDEENENRIPLPFLTRFSVFTIQISVWCYRPKLARVSTPPCWCVTSYMLQYTPLTVTRRRRLVE